MFYVYILYSEKFDKYYIGHTNDPERRLIEHNELSEKSYTSKYRPWEMVGKFEIGCERNLAIKIEKHLKAQKSKKYIQELVRIGSIDLIIKRFRSVG